MKLAVIGTFYKRPENNFPLMHRLFVDSERRPDEAWLMCERNLDALAIGDALNELRALEVLEPWDVLPAKVQVLNTPRNGGHYLVIPYSRKINWALDRSDADAFVYLDNNSMPSPSKYRVMLEALEANPSWGAVYCTQHRTGFNDEVSVAAEPVPDAFCRLNYTQVMHRKTEARWPLDMSLANPDLADATFWRSLHEEVGPFFPAGGEEVHDWHDIPSPAAVGI